MKKIFLNIRMVAFLAIMVSSVSSCKIDITPQDRYTEEVIWNQPQSVELYINGMYNEFKTFQFGTFPIGYNNSTDALTDILKYTSSVSGNGTVNILATDASRVNAAGPQLNYWTAAYDRIRRLNEFLNGIETYSKLEPAQKEQYAAEARFIRGYVYFWLVKLHGSVILLDNISQYSDKNHPRASEDECWNFIASDFAYAAERLPVTRSATTTGRATKGAAYGMLARTWLYAASIAEYDKKQFNQDPLTGVPADKASSYYQNALAATQEVIKLAGEGVYGLDENFAGVFTNKNTKEAIFRIDYVAPQVTHNYDLGFAPPGDDKANALVYGVPTAELVNQFEMSDGTKFSWSNAAQASNPYKGREKRFYATVLYNGATWKGRTINTLPSNSIEGFVEYGTTPEPRRTVTGYYVKKMLDSTNTSFAVNKSSQSWIEMRYAEILLIDAEAKLRLNDIAGAKQSLNQLRNKRGLPDTFANTKAELMEAIEHERIVELAFEGQRYWDLRRWRKAHIVLNNVRFTGHRPVASGSAYTYEVVNADNTDRKFTGALYYIPIPVDEVQRNNALKQIQGW